MTEKIESYGGNTENLPAKQEKVMKYVMDNGDEMKLTFNIVRKYLVQGNSDFVKDSEILYYMHECKARKLNPFLRQCWLIKYSQKDNAQIVESIHHKRAKAVKAKSCRGWEKGLIIQDANGDIKRTKGLLLKDETLLGAYFSATPEGWTTPYELEINLEGYIKKKQNGDLTAFWSKEKQPSQLMKVVESQGLSALWGDTIGNTYIPEELPSIDMFAGEDGAYEQKLDTSGFDKLAVGVKSKKDFESFIEITAKANNVTVDELKVQAAGQFSAFMKSFDIWFEKQKKDEPAEGPESEPEKKEPENWWNDEKHWKFLGGQRFVSAIENHADDLKAAGNKIQKAVYDKFCAKNKKEDWPFVKKEPETVNLSLGGNPGYTARNSEDFQESSNSNDLKKEAEEPSPEESELQEAKSELSELKKHNMEAVEEAAENLKMSVSPMTLDGFTALIEETHAVIDSRKM